MDTTNHLIDAAITIIQSFGEYSAECSHYYDIIADHVGGYGPGMITEYREWISAMDPYKRAFIVREHLFTALARALAGVPN